DVIAPAPPPPPPRVWRWELGARGGVRAGVAPSARPAAEVFAGFASAREGTLAPLLRVGVAGTLPETIAVPTGDASFTWIAGRAEGCPWRFALAPGLATRPCASLELGAVLASASKVLQAQSTARVWAAGGLAWRTTWEVAPGRFFLSLDGEVALPFARD